MSIEKWERDFIIKSSVVPINGVETHIHPFGPKEDNVRIKTSINIGDGIPPLELHNPPFYPTDGF